MQKFGILTAFILFGGLTISPAMAANVIVGVNVVGVQQLSEQQQDGAVSNVVGIGVTRAPRI